MCEKCCTNEASNVLSGVNEGQSIGRTWFLCRSCELEYQRVYQSTIESVACPITPEMSEQEDQVVTKRWRDEVNRQLSEWVLGKQTNE